MSLKKKTHILPCLYPYLADKCLWSTLVIGEFPGGSVVKNLPANTGDGDSIPRLERSSLKFREMSTPFSIFAWRISGTGEPARLQPMGPQRVGCTKNVCNLVVMPAYAGAGPVVDWCLSNTHVNPCSPFPCEIYPSSGCSCCPLVY